MKKAPVICGAIGAAAAANALHAALFRPKKPEVTPLLDEAVPVDRYRRHLSEAIRIRTISNRDMEKVDWAAFDALHAFIDESYPLIREKLKKRSCRRRTSSIFGRAKEAISTPSPCSPIRTWCP